MKRATAKEPIPGWSQLRHTGLLLDGPRLDDLAAHRPEPPSERVERRLRQRATAFLGGIVDGSATSDMSQFVAFVLEEVCSFDGVSGDWQRGSRVPRSLGRRAVTGETVKPRHVWNGPRGASLPVFLDDAKRIGIGRGRRVVSQVLGWLRAGGEHLALVTNGRDWQLVFAGLDYDASCRWDVELWFEEGHLAAQVTALRTLIQPVLWTPPEEGATSPLLQAIRDARKGQADLSEVLGERVREAVEILVQSHGEALKVIERGHDGVTPAEIYRAACRVAMRAVVVLFAESRKLLPRDCREQIECPVFGARELSALGFRRPTMRAERAEEGGGSAHAAASALSSSLPFASYRPSLRVPWKTAIAPSSYSWTVTLART